MPSTTLREVALLQMLSESNHVVKLLDVEHVEENSKPCLYLVFEFLSTDLKKFMDRNGKGPSHPLDPMLVKSLVYQLIKGVAHMHRHGVMHRDLKPQNLLIEENAEPAEYFVSGTTDAKGVKGKRADADVAARDDAEAPAARPPSPPSDPEEARHWAAERTLLKVADLGLGRAFSIPIKAYTHEIVTLWYRAPEVLLGTTCYAPAVDVWSVGCIFAELVRKQALLPGDSELQQLLHIFKLFGTPDESVWPGVSRLRDWHEWPRWRPADLAKIFPKLEPEGLDLMRQMFTYDPAKRISMKEALKHPYFDDLNKEAIDKLENPALEERYAESDAQRLASIVAGPSA